jgi:hypothetical protein
MDLDLQIESTVELVLVQVTGAAPTRNRLAGRHNLIGKPTEGMTESC